MISVFFPLMGHLGKRSVCDLSSAEPLTQPNWTKLSMIAGRVQKWIWERGGGGGGVNWTKFTGGVVWEQ